MKQYAVHKGGGGFTLIDNQYLKKKSGVIMERQKRTVDHAAEYINC